MTISPQILNIDSDVNSRARLRQLLFSVCPNSAVTAFPQPKEGLSRLECGFEYDLLIVSSAFGQEALGPFFERLKQLPNCKEMLIISLLRGGAATADSVMQGVISGIHGVLKEPISASDLEALLERARQMRALREDRKHVMAAEFVVNDAIKYVDEIARRLAKGEAYRYLMKNFRKAMAPLKTLANSLGTALFDTIVKGFTAVVERIAITRAPALVVAQPAPAAATNPLRPASRRIIRRE